MKVLVLNGSPKGADSVTFQSVRYLEKVFGADTFDVIHVGRYIKKLEKDFSEVLTKLKDAELLLFTYPVYTFIAPYQLHRFIEILKTFDIDLSDKFAAQITTSKHFYDVTAHKYIEENVNDLKIKYIEGLSADMEDLLEPKGESDLKQFWQYVRFAYTNALTKDTIQYEQVVEVPYAPTLPVVTKNSDYNGVIVTNCEKTDKSLQNMITDFQNNFPYPTKVVNILEYPFSGGCLGCFNCAATGKCIYKDGFDQFLREEIQTSSTIIFAFRVKDHSMGASFKLYDDRQFCNGHRTVTMGMPMGYIVAGDLTYEANLKMIIEGRAEVGHNYLVGVANDAKGIAKLSLTMTYALKNKLLLPSNFYGVGGMKIFRDLIYVTKGLMREDHRFYKKHGFYDFPQKERGKIMKMKLVGALIRMPSVQKKMGNKMTQAISAPYQKVIDRAVLVDAIPNTKEEAKQ